MGSDRTRRVSLQHSSRRPTGIKGEREGGRGGKVGKGKEEGKGQGEGNGRRKGRTPSV